jgi:peroxiredoxin
MTRTPVAIASALMLMALAGPAFAAPVAGEAAPALVVPEIGGARFDLAALHGKVVVINFWATWCSPCRAEMPALDAFYARFHARGVELVGVSVDRSRDRQAVLKAALALHYPVALLADATTDGFGKPSVLPVTYIVDRKGIVRAVMTPGTVVVTDEALERAVAPFLPGNPPGP